MSEAGYSAAEAQEIKAEVSHYEAVRQEVKLASGDYIDLKLYEPAMRHLLDAYIRAEESEQVSAFDDLTLVQVIVERGAAGVDELPEGIRNNHEAVAETIENNVRRLIIDESAVNPKYYDKMSELLDGLILQRKQAALDYREHLERIVGLARAASDPASVISYPVGIDSGPVRAMYDNLKDSRDEQIRDAAMRYSETTPVDATAERALAVDRAIRGVKKADWRGNRFQEREVRNAIRSVLGADEGLIEAIFAVAKAQDDY